MDGLGHKWVGYVITKIPLNTQNNPNTPPNTSKITNIPLDIQNYQNTPRNVFRCTTFRFIKFDSFHVLQILLILFKVRSTAC